MTSVALIGGDGAGKTTIARHLTTNTGLKAKYLYLGMSAQSADHLLPTSRLALMLKRRAFRRDTVRSTGQLSAGDRIPAERYEYSTRRRGGLWITARLLNRFLEAWFRQIISLSYQIRGYIVVYDRHILIDGGVLDSTGSPHRIPERAYRWVMRTFYPRPELVILLDASGEVLYARKKEASPSYLNRETRMYLAQAEAFPRFVRLDATRSLDDVKREAEAAVAALIAQ